MAIYRLGVTLTYPRPGSPGANVWHFRTNNTGPSASEARTGAVNAIRDFYQDILSSSANIFMGGLRISAENVVDVDSSDAFETGFVLNSGGTLTDGAPDVLCMCVSWRTLSASRRGRGRTFLGPLKTETLQDNGTPSAAAIASVSAAATSLINKSLVDNDWGIGVYGLNVSGGGPTSPRVLRDFTGFKMRDEFAILRSRRD